MVGEKSRVKQMYTMGLHLLPQMELPQPGEGVLAVQCSGQPTTAEAGHFRESQRRDPGPQEPPDTWGNPDRATKRNKPSPENNPHRSRPASLAPVVTSHPVSCDTVVVVRWSVSLNFCNLIHCAVVISIMLIFPPF